MSRYEITVLNQMGACLKTMKLECTFLTFRLMLCTQSNVTCCTANIFRTG